MEENGPGRDKGCKKHKHEVDSAKNELDTNEAAANKILPLSEDPYRNFLREYCHKWAKLGTIKALRQAIQLWREMSPESRLPYIEAAYYASHPTEAYLHKVIVEPTDAGLQSVAKKKCPKASTRRKEVPLPRVRLPRTKNHRPKVSARHPRVSARRPRGSARGPRVSTRQPRMQKKDSVHGVRRRAISRSNKRRNQLVSSMSQKIRFEHLQDLKNYSKL